MRNLALTAEERSVQEAAAESSLVFAEIQLGSN
jgi:hypothetical protein